MVKFIRSYITVVVQLLNTPRSLRAVSRTGGTAGGQLFIFVFERQLSGEVSGYPQALPEVFTLWVCQSFHILMSGGLKFTIRHVKDIQLMKTYEKVQFVSTVLLLKLTLAHEAYSIVYHRYRAYGKHVRILYI